MKTGVVLTTPIGDGIFQIRLPLSGSPLRHVNAYLIEDEDGATLIDCGWRADDVLEALHAGLLESGRSLADVRRLAVTHFHYDHYGLAGTLVRAGVPELLMHRRDRDVAVRYLTDAAASDRASDAWLARNGLRVPPSEDEEHERRNEFAEPTRLVGDGERLGRLRAVWTPGHSPGHLCFVDTRSGRMFTGDHVLDPITPHVGIWIEGYGDPLGDYIASLRKVASIGACAVLPAHGEPFEDLQRRVDELLAHEARREHRVLAALEAGSASAAAIARTLPWTRRDLAFDQLGDWHQQFAVAEAIAHLEHLRVRGVVTRDAAANAIVYSLIEATPS
jgi:glyoxylase-like metal-dependent hydrolase (beta-lactamase superfamily II)